MLLTIQQAAGRELHLVWRRIQRNQTMIPLRIWLNC